MLESFINFVAPSLDSSLDFLTSLTLVSVDLIISLIIKTIAKSEFSITL